MKRKTTAPHQTNLLRLQSHACFIMACLLYCSACSSERTTQEHCSWQQNARNPLISPPDGESIIADPSVITPENSHDNQWHLFANSTILGIHHYTSDNGVDWQIEDESLLGLGAVRPFVYKEKDTYHLFYEQYRSLSASEIRVKTSTDLRTWTEPQTVLTASLDWEKETHHRVGNPFISFRDGQYLLYYSASAVYLDDSGIYEPLYIGLATSQSLQGPWQKHPTPIIQPSVDNAWRNLGAGSFKLMTDLSSGQWLALNNGIYQTPSSPQAITGSAILLLESNNGIDWQPVCQNPVIAPTHSGWNAAYIYAFDPVQHKNTWRLYYNARDDYVDGYEHIGMAELN